MLTELFFQYVTTTHLLHYNGTKLQSIRSSSRETRPFASSEKNVPEKKTSVFHFHLLLLHYQRCNP